MTGRHRAEDALHLSREYTSDRWTDTLGATRSGTPWTTRYYVRLTQHVDFALAA